MEVVDDTTFQDLLLREAEANSLKVYITPFERAVGIHLLFSLR